MSEHDFSWAFHRYTLTNKFPFSPYVPSIHKQIITQSFSNIPLCSNIQHFYFPHQPTKTGQSTRTELVKSKRFHNFIRLTANDDKPLVVIPSFSQNGNLHSPAPINSNSFFEIAFFLDAYIFIKKCISTIFMLYLAESLTGRNYTEGKLIRYYLSGEREREGRGRKLCLLSANSMGFGLV